MPARSSCCTAHSPTGVRPTPEPQPARLHAARDRRRGRLPGRQLAASTSSSSARLARAARTRLPADRRRRSRRSPTRRNDPIFTHLFDTDGRRAEHDLMIEVMTIAYDAFVLNGHTYVVDQLGAAPWSPPGVTTDTEAMSVSSSAPFPNEWRRRYRISSRWPSGIRTSPTSTCSSSAPGPQPEGRASAHSCSSGSSGSVTQSRFRPTSKPPHPGAPRCTPATGSSSHDDTVRRRRIAATDAAAAARGEHRS